MTRGFEDKVEQRYQAEQGARYHRDKRGIPESAYPWIAALRARKIQPQVAPADTVLEYGVGTGWNLAALQCQRRLGFDLAESVAPILAQHGIEFIGTTAALAEGSVDVCLCHHVLEHTPLPPQALADIARLLCPGGKLLLFVPYEKERRYRRYDASEPNHHLYSWNVQTLGNLVAAAGFEILEARIGRFGYDRFAGVGAARLRLGARGFRWIRRGLHLVRPLCEVRIVARKTGPSSPVKETACPA
jgi:SAM-dependent methyltransferase